MCGGGEGKALARSTGGEDTLTVACVDTYRGVLANVGARWKIGIGPVGW